MDMIEEMIDSLANVGTIKNDFVKRGRKDTSKPIVVDTLIEVTQQFFHD